jgi:hypothetical protein
MRLDENNRVILRCDWCGEYNDRSENETIFVYGSRGKLKRRCIDRNGCRQRAIDAHYVLEKHGSLRHFDSSALSSYSDQR